MSGSKASAARARKGKGRGGTGAPPAARGAGSPGAAAPAPVPAETERREGEYVVQLPTFEGPLDLLLHLIQQHELDILDIPVGFITEKYLEYLRLMRSLTIDLASEYLVMAATLAHIKSKMLLPSVPAGQDDDGMPGEEEEDPRAELVRRLLEYQKYKMAAADLAERGTLGRDVFTRGMSESEVPKGPAPFAATNVFSLLDAFERVLKRTNVQIDHEVVFDRISITDRIVELTEKLSARRAMRFEDLLLDSVSKGGVIPKFEIVITFLAILEMCKLKLIRVHQTDALATIHVQLAVSDTTGGDGLPVEESEEASAEPEVAAPADLAVEAAAGEHGAADSEEEKTAIEAVAMPERAWAVEAPLEEQSQGASPVEEERSLGSMVEEEPSQGASPAEEEQSLGSAVEEEPSQGASQTEEEQSQVSPVEEEQASSHVEEEQSQRPPVEEVPPQGSSTAAEEEQDFPAEEQGSPADSVMAVDSATAAAPPSTRSADEERGALVEIRDIEWTSAPSEAVGVSSDEPDAGDAGSDGDGG